MNKYAVKGNHGDDHRRTTCAHEQQTTPTTYHDEKKMRRHRGNRPRPKETEIWELHYETIPNSESSELLLTIKVKILQTRNIETNQLK